MKKIIFSVLIIVIVSLINLSIILTRQSIAEEPGLIRGLKGTYHGKFICHCPDDATTCYCNYSK